MRVQLQSKKTDTRKSKTFVNRVMTLDKQAAEKNGMGHAAKRKVSTSYVHGIEDGGGESRRWLD